jgi:small subunit ribosomal protein S7
MAAAINPFPALRTIPFRPRLSVIRNGVIPARRATCRTFADKSKDLPSSGEGEKGPNMEQQEHVSEEAAKMAKIQGGTGPDIEGQGTPVQDVSGPGG